MKFGEKLQQLRKTKGMSQEDLAEMLNVSRQAVSKWENNQGYPETEKLIMMGNIFQVTMDYLLKEEPSSHNEETTGYYASREMTQGFLAREQKDTIKTCIAISLFIGSGLPVLIFPKYEDQLSIITMAFILIGILIFVSMGFQNDLYQPFKKEYLSFDSNHLQELRNQYQKQKKTFNIIMMCAILLIFTSFFLAILVDDILVIDDTFFDPIYLLLITLSITLFIYSISMMDTYELLCDNETYHKKNDHARLYYITIGCASIVYIALGLLFGEIAWRVGWTLIVLAALITYAIKQSQKK